MSEYTKGPGEYSIQDRSERDYTSYEDVSSFEHAPDLGRDLDITLLIKWNIQRERDEKLRQLGKVGLNVQHGNTSTPGPRSVAGYTGGFIVETNLSQDSLEPDRLEMWPARKPAGIDTKDGQAVYACGNKLLFSPDGNPENSTMEVENPMFARLHSAAFSDDGERVLTASSSLDMLYEVQLSDGDINWSLDLWSETPYNTNDFGHSFYRTPIIGSDYLLNPPSADLEDNEQLRGVKCVVSDPHAYKQLGLSTPLIPVYINSVDYETDDTILATSYSRGEAWRIHRNSKAIEIVAKDLGHPHGLHVNKSAGGYFVSDTLREQVLFLDNNLRQSHVYDLSRLGDRKEGLEDHRWLQYTTELAPGVYCAVMTSRQKLTLFDTNNRTRRDISVPPDWGMQMVVTSSPKK